MTAPVAARGDFGAIEGLISKLQSAQMKAIVTENPAEFAKYGIDPPAAESPSSAAARKPGSPSAEDPDNFIHVRDVSKPQVVTVPADLFDDVEKGPIEYRRKDVFEFRAFNLDRSKSRATGRRRSSSASRARARTARTPGRMPRQKKRWTPRSSKRSSPRWPGTRAQSFADETTKTGLDAPAVTVKATFDGGKKSETVHHRAGRRGCVRRPQPTNLAPPNWMRRNFDETLKALDAFK